LISVSITNSEAKIMTRYRLVACALLTLLASVAALAGENLDVPPGKIPGDKPGSMMNRYWLRQAEQAAQRWQADYAARTTPQQIAAYQVRMRERFLAAIGGLPQRTPLEAQCTGSVSREGYRVEKIIFQSQPKHFVTALLFLPTADKFPPPYPGVLVPCGHAQDAKGHDTYQSMGALLALNGMAALVFDPIDQGERGQYLGPGGWPKLWGVYAHFQVGIGSTLLGRNTARFEIWDAMRGIDYLQSRPEVDPQRIGCTGNSGGGTQTSYMMALDDRIRAAAPSCYLCGFPALLKTIGPQDAEQNIFGQVAFGMDHADYLMMRAPTPILMCTATKDFFDIQGAWDTFRYAKRLYTRLGFAERVDIQENDEKHNYNVTQREGVARWMSRWLLKKDVPIVEPPLKLLTPKELQCTPDGQVMLLPGARSVYDLNEDYERQLGPRRAAFWKTGDLSARLAKVRQLAGIRPLAEIPKPKVELLDAVKRPGYRIEKILLAPEEGIVLPALRFVPEKAQPGRTVLYVHPKGRAADAAPGGAIEHLVQEGNTVLAIDLRGMGQIRPVDAEWKDAYMAYLLGRSYVGLRAEDILIAARYLKEPTSAGHPAIAVELVAVGAAGIPALHAAAVESQLFSSVKLVGTLDSWASVIHVWPAGVYEEMSAPAVQANGGAGVNRLRHTNVQASDIVYNALETYDLPNLAATLHNLSQLPEPAATLPKR
jgi:dienelactone hydrolase